MATEKEIRDALRRWRDSSGHQLIIANCITYGWEADLLSATRKLLVTEHEIKCSHADFVTEMRSASFETDETRRWIVRHEARRAGKSISAVKCIKHARLQDAHNAGLQIRKHKLEQAGRKTPEPPPVIEWVQSFASHSVPNYFTFVSPVGVINVEEVPPYAGLIWYLEGHNQFVNCFEIIKPAPRLHETPMDSRTMLKIARSFEARFWKKYG